jgi:hypothetical protein
MELGTPRRAIEVRQAGAALILISSSGRLSNICFIPAGCMWWNIPEDGKQFEVRTLPSICSAPAKQYIQGFDDAGLVRQVIIPVID